MITSAAATLRPNPWLACRSLPAAPGAVLAALHLAEPGLGGLARLNDRDWRRALDYCDRSRTTLALRRAARHLMPAWVRERTDGDAQRNALRVRTVGDTYSAIAQCLGAGGIEFLALKGIAQCALFGTPAEERVQYDIDLFTRPEIAQAAETALRPLGYQRIPRMEGFPTDHLPTLILRNGWEWRGDFFDVTIPLSVDLHFRFWNDAVERIAVPGTEEFWDRRIHLRVAGAELDVLRPVDALAYAALHFLRHVLRGDALPFHGYEIASLLESKADDVAFWNERNVLHPAPLCRLQALAFRLAADWFGCRLAPAIDRDVAELPPATLRWLAHYATSPLTAEFDSNKDELWLHLSLIPSRRDRWSVARRRLMPGNLPHDGSAVHIPEGELTWRKRVKFKLRHFAYLLRRARRHAVSLARTAYTGIGWWRRNSR